MATVRRQFRAKGRVQFQTRHRRKDGGVFDVEVSGHALSLAGKPVLASGDANTAMGGLACREISPITWPVLGLGTDWFMTIAEDQVMPARKLYAHPLEGDPALTSGPSGCAGLAGLTRVAADEEAFKTLGLGPTSRVLLINSEGNLGEGAV